jgi:hypothetical protein
MIARNVPGMIRNRTDRVDGFNEGKPWGNRRIDVCHSLLTKERESHHRSSGTISNACETSTGIRFGTLDEKSINAQSLQDLARVT